MEKTKSGEPPPKTAETGEITGVQMTGELDEAAKDKLIKANQDQHRIIMSLTVQCKMGHYAHKSIQQHFERQEEEIKQLRKHNDQLSKDLKFWYDKILDDTKGWTIEDKGAQ